MSQLRTHAVRATAALAATVLLSGLAGCSNGAASPGITDDTIKVGMHAPLTGPASAGYATISASAKAYFAYLNEHGGINGRQVDLLVEDDGYDPKTTQKVVQKLVEDDGVFAILGGLGTATHRSVVDYLNTKKVPDIFVSSGSPSWGDAKKYPYTFGWNPDYIIEAKVLAHYAEETYTDSTYCVLGQDDDLGEDFTKGLDLVLGDDALASEQSYSVTTPDVTAQIAAMKAAGCTVNFLATVPGFTALAIGTAAKMGYQANWLASNVGGDYATIASYLGKPAPVLLEGFITTNYLPITSGDPWVELFREINTEYGDGLAFDANTIYGMSQAYTFAEAMTKAGDNPTRQDLIDTLQSGRVVGNGIFPLTLSDTIHSAYQGVQITHVTAGIQGYTGSPYITSDGKGAIVEYVGKPVEMPNDDGLPTK